jgi:hypothetical protein
MPSNQEFLDAIKNISVDADTLNLNTDQVESKLDTANGLLTTLSADTAIIKADMADGVAVRETSTTGATPTTFDSTSYATISASNANRKGLAIFNEGAGLLYVTLGTSTTTSSLYTVRLSAGDYYEVPFGYTGLVGGIFATAGTARVTQVS